MEKDIAPSVPITDNNKKSNGKKWKIVNAIACILAVCGIGFGIYGMIQSSQKDSQISDLKVQVEDSNGEITALEAEKIETTADNGTTVTIADTARASGGPYIESGYFYVPDWELKFKIPEDLANYGYSVDYAAQTGYTLPSIGFTAMLKSDKRQNAQARYYDSIETCAIVNVSKENGSWDTKRQINGIVKQFDNYALLIWNYSRHRSCDYALHIDEVQEKIQAMFSNPEKI